jgi:tRNA threonylcarbamoyladenosine biosynthesis protein TsaE
MTAALCSIIVTASPEETFQIGAQFGQTLDVPCIIALCGDLGAGKTTFIRGLASSLGADEREVCSPTFTYLNIYQGSTAIYHFDLYRIPTQHEFEAAGFDEYLHADGVSCIEWSEKISSLLRDNTLPRMYRICIAHAGEGLREICIT